MQLEGAPGNRLRGTLVRPLVGGIATFPDLSVERAGPDLKLVASLISNGPTNVEARSISFSRGVRSKRHIILMIADGLGYQQIGATTSFTGKASSYAALSSVAMATWDENVRQSNGDPAYDPKRAWTEFIYLIQAATDSGSSATAMYTGVKTNTGRLSVAAGTPGTRLQTIARVMSLRRMRTRTGRSVSVLPPIG